MVVFYGELCSVILFFRKAVCSIKEWLSMLVNDVDSIDMSWMSSILNYIKWRESKLKMTCFLDIVMIMVSFGELLVFWKK